MPAALLGRRHLRQSLGLLALPTDGADMLVGVRAAGAAAIHIGLRARSVRGVSLACAARGAPCLVAARLARLAVMLFAPERPLMVFPLTVP